jgi:CheY-like chemotaxis protein
MTIGLEKTRILIVDDSIVIRDLIRLFYYEFDVELIEAVSGTQAVEVACSCTHDLIPLDAQMPVMAGCEVAAILKNDEAVKNVPILVITGQWRGKVAALIRGMYDGYLSKPFKKAI